jgi:hypothetical protein
MERGMIRAIIDEASALIALALFVAMVLVWADIIGRLA